MQREEALIRVQMGCKLRWKRKKTINMDSRSQPSKSVVAPLVRCPSCTASTAARNTCQIHRPAQPACLAPGCLLALANTALSLHCSLPVWPVCSVPSLPVPERETVGYDVIGCAGQRQQQQRSCPMSGMVYSCEMDNAGYCEKRGEDDEYYKRSRTTSHFVHRRPFRLPATGAQAQTVAT